jgi:3-hydroxy-9,10-secoandrosta-1,3,5(10)-triene-9,17-dione monooxygenase
VLKLRTNGQDGVELSPIITQTAIKRRKKSHRPGKPAAERSAASSAGKLPQPLQPPEPDMTPDILLQRARNMRDMLRADQDGADERGCQSQEVQDAFVKAGFYRIVQPRLFGGYEFDYATFYRVMAEVSRGHPSVGWCLALGASHAAIVAAFWPLEVQEEVFGKDGHFIAPHRAVPVKASCRKVEGGYEIEGLWAWCSGIPYATHFIGNVSIEQKKGPPRQLAFIVPRDRIEVLDDWGGDATLGMRASGSNSVRMKPAFVAEKYVVPAGPGLWSAEELPEGTHGTRIHGNPMYLCRMMGPYHASLVVPVLGAARAALDEFEEISGRRQLRWPPFGSWQESADIQRPFGQALMLADSAEALVTSALDQYMALCRRWAEDGNHFSLEDSLRLWGMIIKAGHMSCEAVDLMFAAASSSAARKGQRMERYYRDCAMYRSHTSSQAANIASGLARAHFGQPMGMFGV